MTRAKLPRPRILAVFALVAALAAVVATSTRGPSGLRGEPTPLESTLAYRGHVGWFGPASLPTVDGARIERVEAASAFGRALVAAETDPIRDAFEAAGIRTLVLEIAAVGSAPEASFVGRIARYGFVPGFHTVLLEAGRLVVEPFDLPSFTDAERAAAPRVARQILLGGTPPRISQFPARLRAPVPVEVLLALRRRDGGLALWRSARATSIASGLLTTTRVAMERWEARRENLGGSLADAVRAGDVEVAILVDEGTIATRAPGFVDRVVGPGFGVAYDDHSSWHYLLPDAPARVAARTGSAAFAALFEDTQRRTTSIDDPGIRLYRIRVLPVGVDRASDARDR